MLTRRHLLQLSTLSAAPLCAQLAQKALAASEEANPSSQQPNILFNFFPEGAYPAWFFPESGPVTELPRQTQALKPVLKDCTFIRGLSLYGGFRFASHDTQAYILTAGEQDSFDNRLAFHLQGKRPFNSIRAGVHSGLWQELSHNFIGGQPLAHEDNPATLYKVLFGDGPTRADALASSALKDTVGTELGQKVEQQLDALASLANMIPPLNMRGVSYAHLPEALLNHADKASYLAEITDIQQNILAMALCCELTHVSSFMLGHTLWPISPIQGFSSVDLGHSSYDVSSPMVEWYMQRFANLLQKLTALPGRNGKSLLDDTYVLNYSNLGKIAVDINDDMPFVLAGGSTFGHQGAYCLDYRENSVSQAGLPHNNLYLTLAHAMGVPLQRFGIEGSTGEYPHEPLPNFWQREGV